jgi:hypothetical protein
VNHRHAKETGKEHGDEKRKFKIAPEREFKHYTYLNTEYNYWDYYIF